ncbi:MAG: alpha/beta hydrolase [Verrucomicrobiae bacterium]|nr:alpha/beta hydrolase [Verrucomicrobiae bacterium]
MKLLASFALLLASVAVLPGQQNPGRRLPEGTRVNKDIVYESVQGRDLHLDLYRPAEAKGSLPLVIWIHGGGWRNGSKEGTNAVRLLPHGYAVASVEYRLSGEAIFPAAIEDCKAAISYLRCKAEDYGLDPFNFGVWGSSAGGHLVSLLGTTNDVLTFDTHPVTRKAAPFVQAVCNWFGPTDFLRMNDVLMRMDHNSPFSPESRFIGGPIQENKERVQLANPITYVSPSDPPFLHMHGDKDGAVIFNQSELLNDALTKAGVPSTLYKVKNGDHGFRGADDSPEKLFAMVLEFFDSTLKD